MGFVEKRQSERIDAKQEFSIEYDGAQVVGVSENISLGGASVSVELDPLPKVGARLPVSFRIPTLADPIKAKAEVRWVAGGGLIGLQFITGFRAKETWALGRFLDDLGAKAKAGS